MTAGSLPPPGPPAGRLRHWARRLILATVVIGQLALVVRGYSDPHHVMAFQMFPEASEWRADVFRVTTDGRRLPLAGRPWPGGYEWADLVSAKGLADPHARHPATDGLAATLDFLANALDWVARNTPADPETRYLVAEVTYWENGRGPRSVVLRSIDRLGGGGAGPGP